MMLLWLTNGIRATPSRSVWLEPVAESCGGPAGLRPAWHQEAMNEHPNPQVGPSTHRTRLLLWYSSPRHLWLSRIAAVAVTNSTFAAAPASWALYATKGWQPTNLMPVHREHGKAAARAAAPGVVLLEDQAVVKMADQADIHCTNGHRPSPGRERSKFCVVCGAPIVVACPGGHEVQAAPYCRVCGLPLPLPPGASDSVNDDPTPTANDEQSPTSPQVADVAGAAVGAGWSAREEGLSETPRLRGAWKEGFGRSSHLIIASMVLIVLLIGTGAYFVASLLTSSHSEKPAIMAPPVSAPAPSVDSPRQEATALNVLLDRSVADRATVVAAVQEIEMCSSLSSAQQDLRGAAEHRQALLDQLGHMNLSELPTGEQLRAKLQGAWQSSAQSDRNYASWAEEAQAAGCSPGGSAPHTPSYTAAQSTDQAASQEKSAFVAPWNAVASNYGLPQRREGEL